MSDKATRWLDLLAFLLYRRSPVSREEIFARVTGYGAGEEDADSESVRRTFERDKSELRTMGVDIETVELPHGAGDESQHGYRLASRDFYLPYFELTPRGGGTGDRPYAGLRRVEVDERDLDLLDRATRRVAERTDLPLAEAAASARRKLEFDLPIVDIPAVVRRIAEMPNVDALALAQDAVARAKTLRCRYYSIARDTTDERVLEPYGLFFQFGRWYCVARTADGDGPQVFRVDRMSQPSVASGGKRDFNVPADFRVQRYLGRAPWELTASTPVTTRVRFAFPHSRIVEAQGLGRVVERRDYESVFEFDVREEAPFVRWLLPFRQHASVESPASVAEVVEKTRQAVRDLYGGGGA